MNSRHKKALGQVFKEPVPGTLEWAAIEGLLIAVGCQVIEGRGSRVRFEKNGVIASFHSPHPAKEAKRYQVKGAKEFLTQIGITP